VNFREVVRVPLYEYECSSCRQRFERIQKFSDPPIESCPSCSGQVSRLISSSAIRFKGSGWYVTDYARKSGTSEKSEKPEGGANADQSSPKLVDSDKKESPAKKSSES
jgi:putative FmdB family regulatory protein